MRIRVVRWWGWAAIGWGAVSAAVAVAVGRAIRAADRREQPHRDGPPYPRMPEPENPSLAGAILTLAYCTDETSARFWLAECARRGADWDLQRQMWDTWQAEHARDVTTLHTDPEGPNW